MKTKSYKHGKETYKAYMKKIGHGYEVGLVWKTKPLFVGNFLHSKEATAWYTMMNREITKFAKKYWVTDRSSKIFYHRFITNNLYKVYYSFLDKHFTKYNRDFDREFKKSERQYKQLKKAWIPSEKIALKRAA